MEETEILEALQVMEGDPSLVTKSAYRANAEHWPGNSISFIEAHLFYLKSHPAVNPSHYLSNLRLMLRKKP
ncbi:MAG TPA: hypothetical protein VLE74_03235 [Candidatus Saccharimonadales bacterium]|nr:hypothetical protein [Candidatus Saccharimonadales bacterium]